MNTGSSHAALARAATAAVVVGCFVALSFLGALHSPRPHDVPLGLVGPTQATSPLATQLSAKAPGAFEFHEYTSLATARAAVRNREVDAAFAPGPQSATLVTASAAGAASQSNLVQLFRDLTSSTGTTLDVTDMAPLPDGDRAGLSPFLLAMSVLLPSLAAGVGIATLGRASSSRRRLLAAATTAAGIGLINALMADHVLGALTGHYWELAGTAGLLSLAVSAPALALHRLLGVAGLGITALVFLVLGIPASGAAVGPHYIPDIFSVLTFAFPLGEAIPVLRNIVYFEAVEVLRSLTLLGAWAAAGALVLLLPGRSRPRHPTPGGQVEPEPA